MKKRTQYSPAFKLKAVLMLLKEEKTAAEIASELALWNKSEKARNCPTNTFIRRF